MGEGGGLGFRVSGLGFSRNRGLFRDFRASSITKNYGVVHMLKKPDRR